MAYCNYCDQHFATHNGYVQHVNTSAAHNEADWECSVCDRCFVSDHARTQHYINGPHPYCNPCDRVFQNQNSYNAHMHSRIHMGNSIQCPFCKRPFTVASGVVIHLESGNCSSGINRQKINEAVRNLDRNNVITRPMITMPGYDNVQTIATERSFNGSYYECCLCPREFGTLQGLNAHMRSPVHEQAMYRCPKRSCGTNFRLLSSLVQHVESESCGAMQFGQVQQQARNGIHNMVGRMITR